MDLLTSRRADQLDDALAAVPRPAEGLEREVALVRALRAVPAPAPGDEFRTALRTRLLAVAAVQGVGETARAPVPAAVSWRRRVGAVAAGLTASAVAVTGVAAAADQSLPGDPFYGLKRVVEGVQLRLADGAAEEGQRHLQFAGERVQELRELALGRDLDGRDEPLSADDAARVEDLLDDLDAETRSAQRLLTEAFRAGDAGPVEDLARFAEAAAADLADVLPALPADVRPRLRESLDLVGDVRTTAGDLLMLRDCATACDPAGPPPAGPTTPGSAGGCGCATPGPAPSVAPPPPPPAPSAPPSSGSTPSPAPAPSGSAGPQPTSTPAPGASPTPTPLLPVPTPPLPTVTLPPLEPLLPGATVGVPPLPGVSGALPGAVVPGAVVPGALLLLLRRRRR